MAIRAAMASALLSTLPLSPRSIIIPKSSAQMNSSTTISQETQTPTPDQKKARIFVAGSSGRTGKKIVEQLLSKGYAVRAGAIDLDKARSNLPKDPNVDFVP
ncbi:uncharacterized protein A4U43_C01F31520 [Asparagus officinalis]|uniref:NAD(P)-binding domain-containing protein n=1 Tax=Asparagus officinalis TaxID=4686 RepID=A0A5P1FUJ7_ASPOF|nr:uncharacterized protein A4U43_C01F31520 [Asparagus officinalis]